jgi:hypothetical protein
VITLVFAGIQVVANPILSLAWHYARLQGTGRGVCNAPFSYGKPGQHKPSSLIPAQYRRDRKDLTQ